MKNFNLEKLIVDVSKIGGSSLNFIIREALSYQNLEIVDDKIVEKEKITVNLGDWFVKKDGSSFSNGEHIARVIKIAGNAFQLNTLGWITPDEISTVYEKWSIKNARPGDIIAITSSTFKKPFVAIFKDYDESSNTFSSYCFYNHEGEFLEGMSSHNPHGVRPAKREEKILLLDSIDEEGYIWDSKHLKLYRMLLVKD